MQKSLLAIKVSSLGQAVLMLFSVACALADELKVGGSSASDENWYREPFRIQTGDVPLDIADDWKEYGAETSGDYFGHAGPCLVDIAGNGRKDLVVSGFNGRFRIYRNQGTDTVPQFGREFTFIMADGQPAKVLNYCCMAPRPVFLDLDGDGILDFISGGYDPGEIYWFKGLGGGHFTKGRALVSETGWSVIAHPEKIVDSSGRPLRFPKDLVDEVGIDGLFHKAKHVVNGHWVVEPGVLTDQDGKTFPWNDFADNWLPYSGASTAAMVDWYDHGKQDLLLGTGRGEILVFANVGTRGTPLFSSRPIGIKINGEKAIPGVGHASVAVADWDGDGLWDILAGSYDGAVYWFRNTGKPGAPEFKTRQQLIAPGEADLQWMERGETPRRGIRSQIQVVDYNGDGKPDILLGDWAVTISPRQDLTADEEKKMRGLRAQLEQIESSPAYRQAAASGRKSELDAMLRTVLQDLAPYLEKYETPNGPTAARAHGYVWVFLHK